MTAAQRGCSVCVDASDLSRARSRAGSIRGRSRRGLRLTDRPDHVHDFPHEFVECRRYGGLDELGLKFDRDGNRRTAYSLRHTYICLRLMEGADIYQVAKNCRTSVEMIEKYYATHLKTTLDAAAINVRRPRPKRNDDDAKRPS
jgi:integrase